MGAVCSACIAPEDADPSAPGAAGKYEVANLTPRQKQVLRVIEKFPELLEFVTSSTTRPRAMGA